MTTDYPHTVDVTATIDGEPHLPGILYVRGGLCIRVDGTPVLQRRDEREGDTEARDGPEVGQLLPLDLLGLLERLVALRQSETDRYEMVEMRFEGTNWRLAFERLSNGYVRVAGRYDSADDEGPVSLTPASERGYAVRLTDLSQAAVDCGETFLDEVAAFDVDTSEEPLPEIRAAIESLRE